MNIMKYWISFSKVFLKTLFENFGRGTKLSIVHIIMTILEHINFLGKFNRLHMINVYVACDVYKLVIQFQGGVSRF